jgi:hypothetical protein
MASHAAKAGLLSILLIAAGPLLAGEFLCCTDAGGRKVCGDTLPPACTGKGYQIFNSQGVLTREVGPPLTAEQKAAKTVELQHQKEEDARHVEQQRKDAALLETYGSAADIDFMRKRQEDELIAAINGAKDKVIAAQVRRRDLRNDAEFYRNKQLPRDLAKSLSDEEIEIRAQTSFIEGKQRELTLLRAKYDEDKQRYLELSRRRPVR